MKKLLIALVLIAVMIMPCFAAIEKTAVEAQATNLLSQVKARLTADVKKYVNSRQAIEDKLANHVANLDAVDQTKLNALPGELQDIIDAMNDLLTKINTHYPSVE